MIERIPLSKFIKRYKPKIKINDKTLNEFFEEKRKDIKLKIKVITIKSIKQLVAEIMIIDFELGGVSKVDDFIMDNFNSQYQPYIVNILENISIPNNGVIGTEIIERSSFQLRKKFLLSFASTGYTAGANLIMSVTEPLMQMSLSSAGTSGSTEQGNMKSGIKELHEIIKALKEPKDPLIFSTFTTTKTVEDVFDMRGEYNEIFLGDLIVEKVGLNPRDREKMITPKKFVDGFPSWAIKYFELRGFEDPEFVSTYLEIKLDVQLLYEYNISPFKIVSKIGGDIKNATFIPSYFADATILAIPDLDYADEEYLYGTLSSDIKKFLYSGIPGVKQIYPSRIPLWSVLSIPSSLKRGGYKVKKNNNAKSMKISNGHFIRLFEFVGFTDIEIVGDEFHFNSEYDPKRVRDTFAKYQINRDPLDMVIMLLKNEENIVSYDMIDAEILNINVSDIESAMEERGAISVDYLGDGQFSYSGNPDLKSSFEGGGHQNKSTNRI